MKYPKVIGEHLTLAKLADGFSIARFGDGEFKMVDGKGYVRQPANLKVSEELQKTLAYPHPNCIIGIPTLDPEGPKYSSWIRHKDRFLKLLPYGVYYSAFISRPDSAPWIRTLEFAQLYQSLWLGKTVAVVCESKGSALRAVRLGARRVHHIPCPSENAYAHIASLEKAVLYTRPDIAILSVGVTATCLANRLTHRGIQAIDFGSGGAFIAQLLSSKPEATP